MKRKHNYFFGKLAEYLAALLLLCKGYKIINHRMRNLYGEIDLVAVRADLIVFVEVKLRRNFQLRDVVSLKQRQRIINAAKFFLQKYPRYANCDVRFDLIFITFCKITHIRNVFNQVL